MVARLLQLAEVPVALAGVGIAAYLTSVHYGGLPLVCEGAGGCHTVQSSEYATLLGVPVAVLGLVLYSAILLGGLTTIVGSRAIAQISAFAVFGMALSGLLYSSYLTWLELYRIYAICAWCVASASLLATLFVLATVEIVVSGRWRDEDSSDDSIP